MADSPVLLVLVAAELAALEPRVVFGRGRGQEVPVVAPVAVVGLTCAVRHTVALARPTLVGLGIVANKAYSH